MSEKNWALLIASELCEVDPQTDNAVERLREAIGQCGYNVTRTFTLEDGLAIVETKPVFRVVLIGWNLARQNGIGDDVVLRIITAARQSSVSPVVFLVGSRTLRSEVPTEVSEQVNGYIDLFRDEPLPAASRIHLVVVACQSN